MDVYRTMGRYDFTAVVDAPDDVTSSSLLYSTGALGNIRTETLRAFTRQETEQALAKMWHAAKRNDARPHRASRLERLAHPGSSLSGTVKLSVAPPSELLAAESRPPWASIKERAIDSPMPSPDDFVV